MNMQHAMHCATYYHHMSMAWGLEYIDETNLALAYMDHAWNYLLASCKTVTLSAADPNAQHS